VRVLFAPDKLKGTYSAAEAAAALMRGWRAVRLRDGLTALPLADGGEGTAAALLDARGGAWREVEAHDAQGRPCRARYAELPGREAAVDVAEACGLWRVADLPPDPLGASSLGAGELIRAAIDGGARRVIVGVGGTASTDGGEGLRRGLGEVPAGVELVAALDVDNVLLGPEGAAAVYGPQKGASPSDVAVLDRRLEALGLSTAALPGAGAGGGIGGMLMALGAIALPGATLVMQETGFTSALAGMDLCITAEGRIDGQTLRGKVVAAVARACCDRGVTCAAVGGGVEPGARAALESLGASVLEQGDLEEAGRQLAASA
jgi:glycerate 2-kinase